jgi:hypothetical protein
VFLQNGRKISELPLVVKKVRDIFELYRRMGIQPAASSGKVLISIVNFISLSSAPDDKEGSVLDQYCKFYTVSLSSATDGKESRDTDPRGSSIILVGWIPIWIRIGNVEQDPDPGGQQ